MRKGTAAVLALLGAASSAMGPAQDARPGHFTVFFDWGKTELSRDGSDVLDAVAAAWAAHPARLLIAGYSDRSGSAAGNLASSRRRAEVVRAYLEGQGVPTKAMTVSAWGEARPLVPTADGVRELQNRRVEIVFE